MSVKDEFQFLCDYVAANENLQKNILFDLSVYTDTQQREMRVLFYAEEFKAAAPHVGETDLYLFGAMIFGVLDRKIDQLQALLNSLNKSLTIMPMRARRANLLARSYDAKNKRDQVMDVIQNGWLKEIEHDYVHGMQSMSKEELNQKQLRDAKRQIDIATINALNLHDKDVPRLITDDIYRVRQEEAREEQLNIDIASLTV